MIDKYALKMECFLQAQVTLTSFHTDFCHVGKDGQHMELHGCGSKAVFVQHGAVGLLQQLHLRVPSIGELSCCCFQEMGW